MDVVRRICDRVAVLDSGEIVERGDVIDVFLHPQHATTKRFVNEALPEEAVGGEEAFARVPGRILRLSFRGEATWTPALGQVARETGIDFNLLAGRIDRIKDMPYGQLTLAMQGERIDAAMLALRKAGIEIEELRA
jgi:D-methionine transport system ATP-binding protein